MKSCIVPVNDPYAVLGLEHGATGKQVKAAYRRLAMRYHPDHNQAPGAREKFQQITDAYERLIVDQGSLAGDTGYDDRWAREIYRRERARKEQWQRARAEQKRKQDAYFEQPHLHDPILAIKYMIHGLGLMFGIGAIIGPVLLAIFVDPVSLGGTFFFILAGVVILLYIWQNRRRWFRLGKFKTTWQDVRAYLSVDASRVGTQPCQYAKGRSDDGKPLHIELHKTTDIRFRSYGALDHEARIRSKTRKVEMPRSARAQLYHRLSTVVKFASIAGCLLLFPVHSLVWRFVAGILVGWMLSAMLLFMAGVRPKSGYLFTPSLLIKAGIWILSLALISQFGPGLEVHVSGYVYLVLAGLLFLLDMVFDLVMGLFPFYSRLFIPVFKQGRNLDRLYGQGYQNYQEMPVFSVLYPLFRWIF